MLDRVDAYILFKIACFLNQQELSRLKRICKRFNNCNIIDLLIWYRNTHKLLDDKHDISTCNSLPKIYVCFTEKSMLLESYYRYTNYIYYYAVYKTLCNCCDCKEFYLIPYKLIYKIETLNKIYNKIKLMEHNVENAINLIEDNVNCTKNYFVKKDKSKFVNTVFKDTNFIEFLNHNPFSFNKIPKKIIQINVDYN